MTVITAIIVFLLIWWLTLFCVLPWKTKPPQVPEQGHAPSAPERPMLVRKMVITTLIATVLFLIVYGLIEFDVISFRRLSQDM